MHNKYKKENNFQCNRDVKKIEEPVTSQRNTEKE